MDRPSGLVDRTSSSQAKIALFRSLFRGREDVYPRRFESRTNFGHARQAASLRPLARKAKSLKPLNPSVRLVASLARSAKVSEAPTWKLSLNVPLEIDAWFAEVNRLAAEPFMPKGRQQPPRQDETCLMTTVAD